jgi:GDP-L-fucose synthase
MPTNLYGPNDKFHDTDSHVIPALIHRMHQAKMSKAPHVIVWGSGTPLREFLYVDDLARACIHLIEHYNDVKPLNIGSGEEISIRDLAELIAEIIGYPGRLVFDDTKPDGTPRKLLDSRKIRALGWDPQTTLEDGLHKTYNWYKQQAA